METELNYSYLVLVVAGLALSITGFVINGKHEGKKLGPALLFLLGIVTLTFGILLTCVPGFFSS